ncbi:hypothetical protein RF55_23303 [Lasius niger]|uniref:Peptidase aspartic putative domain-containing protein n=1 Tax=Lasius niger TaxID=67767 RepID=A0A0J7MP10_LASNI|nr:hypothetical protein RF55_23303 [Lasius niger]
MPISISAVRCVDAGTCRYAALIQISPFDKAHPVLTTTESILKSLTNYSPSPVLSNINWSHLADLTLVDSDPLNADPIDIIIADLYSELLLDGIRKGISGQPLAQNTILGWVLSGLTSAPVASRQTITVQHCSSSLLSKNFADSGKSKRFLNKLYSALRSSSVRNIFSQRIRVALTGDTSFVFRLRKAFRSKSAIFVTLLSA